jgi:arsenite-transporting ATPase
MPKFQFFTGKGGVGKTSLACATAVQLADQGQLVLLISTDPASNLADVLQTPVGEHAAPHAQLANLWVVNIDPEVAAEDYRQRATAPLKGIASEAEIAKVREGLSGACTTEIASFDEFSRFLTGEGSEVKFDTIIFDTAPTGHTLRLLELPAAWEQFISANPSGASCLGPSSALKSSHDRYRNAVEALRNPDTTTLMVVARPDAHSLKEAARTSHELHEMGLHQQQLLVNGVFSALDATDEVAAHIEQMAHQQLDAMPSALRELPLKTYPLLPYNVLGLDRLRSMTDEDLQANMVKEMTAAIAFEPAALPDLRALADGLLRDHQHGLVLTMGKGGVGKTITAAALAVMLARTGQQVLLTTTDPAGHISDFLTQLEQLPPTLTVERIDPKEETQRYIDKVMAQKGKGLDEEGRRLLLEDLRSPCTEEVAVFHAFSKALQKARRQWVVVDTAPTGHTLLLLDTTGSYHQEVLRHSTLDASRITTPFMQLQDPALTHMILVTLPETTPMREAASLQEDLRRAGIEPYAWVVNQCLSAVAGLRDPILTSRASAEKTVIEQIQTQSKSLYAIPFLSDENVLNRLLISLEGA